MNCDVVVSAEDFKTIHNTLWELEYQGLNGKVGAERIRAALGAAYAQDDADFDSKMDYYNRFKEANGLRTIWSIYELPVHGFLGDHPYVGAAEICYRDHWGDEPVYETIQGPTWADLYRAADRCVQRSGDGHHVFIEAFTPVADQPHQLRLSTGS